MRDHLRNGPVHVTIISKTDASWCNSRSPHSSARNQHFQVDIKNEIIRPTQIWQRLRISDWTRRHRNSIWLECIERNNPTRKCRCEIFRNEWTKRLILPLLNIPRTPIIQEQQTKDRIDRTIDANRVADYVACADECTNFHFIIHQSSGTKCWRTFILCHSLTIWANDLGTAWNHRTRTSVISNRQVFPIWKQRIIRAKHASNICRVMNRGIEICVITNLTRNFRSHSPLWKHD